MIEYHPGLLAKKKSEKVILPIDRKLNSRPFELKPSGSTYQPRPPLQVTLGYSLLSHSIVEIDSVAANRSASVDSFTEKIAISSVVRPEDTVTEHVPHRYSHGTHNRTPTFDIESGSHFRENRELPRNPESADDYVSIDQPIAVTRTPPRAP